jgi:hypothetical protein
MNTYEDDEFKRIEMEQKLREKQKETFGIPFVTQEELEQLLKDYDETQ